MNRTADFYLSVIVACGAIFAGAWLGRTDIVFAALGLLALTAVHELGKP